MNDELRKRVIIGEHGQVDLADLGLPEGTIAELTIRIENVSENGSTMSDMIGCGRGCYASPEEAVGYIRQLRNE
jgi:hypothetical protein